VGQTEDQIAEATIDTLDNLATVTSPYRGVVATLIEPNSLLASQLEDLSNELKEVKALLKKEKAERKGQITFNRFWTIIVGHMDIRWQKVIQVRVVTIPRVGTSVRLPRITIWEEAKPTRNDV
jgi:hypothetical protein